MIHAQEVVVRRAYVSPERVALEQKIPHIGSYAKCHLVHYLSIRCSCHVQSLRWREQQIFGDSRIGAFEEDRIAESIEPVGSQLATAVILANDFGDMGDGFAILGWLPSEVTPRHGADHKIFSRGELSIKV